HGTTCRSDSQRRHKYIARSPPTKSPANAPRDTVRIMTAALIVCLLPAVIAFAGSSRGIRRILWLAGALACAAVMIMTVSRGAFAGLFVGGLLAMYLCRRWLSLRQVVPWAAAALLLTVGLLLAVSAQVGDLLGERLLGQTLVIDVGQASSGRTDIWSAAIERMARTPITLLTGFGWDVYSAMPFRFAPHNHYLGLWFNLGIVGLGAFLVLLTQCLRVARTGLAAADPAVRGQLIAFIFGMLSLAVAVFFTDLTTPWLYIWAYIGVTMRMALLPHAEPHRERVPAKPLRWAA
ncbi:MAG: O-antigen ligase family protein, partial [Gammaproteobacteria bacterium]